MENNTSNTTSNNKPENVELGALWKRKAKSDGQVYLAGHIKVGDDETLLKVVVFSNKNKSKDNQPDYRVYESKPYNPTAAVSVAAGEEDQSDRGTELVKDQESEDLL